MADKQKILQISVYVENLESGKEISSRTEVIEGLPDWHSIIQNEVEGRLIKRVQEESSTLESMIVTGKSQLNT